MTFTLRAVAPLFAFLLVCSAASAQSSGGAAPTAQTAPATVTIDWNARRGRVAPAHYGLNLYAAFSPENTRAKPYLDNVAYMGAGLLRLHHAGKMNDSKKAWEGAIDEKRRIWDEAKVVRVIGGLRTGLAKRGNPQLLINVPGWPGWMDRDRDGFLDADQKEPYARLLADLVRIVNVKHKLGVRFWEVTNERDGLYFTDFHDKGGWGDLKDPAKPDRLDELADIYNHCAPAMKAVDRTIKVGGPAAARPDLVIVHERFARQTAPNLDFYSLHAYASGSRDTPDDDIYNAAENMGNYVKQVVEILKRVSPRRSIPVLLDEFNISWTWETRDPRMTGVKGAVFDALVYLSAIENGVYSACAWNEKDGIYGKTDGDNRRRPGADLLHHLRASFVGERVAAAVRGADRVRAFAVRNGKRRSVLLINRGDVPQTVQTPWLAQVGPVRLDFLVEGGDGQPLLAENADTIYLPSHSVAVAVYEATDRR